MTFNSWLISSLIIFPYNPFLLPLFMTIFGSFRHIEMLHSRLRTMARRSYDFLFPLSLWLSFSSSSPPLSLLPKLPFNMIKLSSPYPSILSQPVTFHWSLLPLLFNLSPIIVAGIIYWVLIKCQTLLFHMHYLMSIVTTTRWGRSHYLPMKKM